MSDGSGNGRTHGIHKGIGKQVAILLPHNLIEHFQCSQEDSECAACPYGDGDILPALLVRKHFTLELTDQVIIDGVAYLLWRGIPCVTGPSLPDIGIEPGEKGL